MAIFLSLTFSPLQSSAATKATAPTAMVATTPVEATEAKALLLRLDEIKAMDKSNMSASEKTGLRKEVRSIKHNLRAISGGVYLSVGAIILIVILLIILL